MQHRGQDGAGLVTRDGESLQLHKDIGLVNDVFEQAEFADLSGHAAIGHIRNATHDDGNIENVQPLVFRSQTGGMALAHNGNIMNAYTLRGELEGEGSIFQTTSDTEVLRSEEHTSELQSRGHIVCRLLLEKKKNKKDRAKQ